MRADRLAVPLLLLVALAGCTPADPVETPSASPTVPPPDTLPPESEGPGCEDIIPASLVDTFTGVRWTAEPEPWMLGGAELADAILCTWTDPADEDSEAAVFAYAAPSSDGFADARTELESAGWAFEPGDQGEYASSSSEGGVYLFHEDGSLRFADSHEQVDLITPPD